MNLEQVIARAAEIDGELAELEALDELDEEQEARFDELVTEGEEIAETRARLEARAEARSRVRSAAENPENRVAGDAPKAFVRTERKNPYDIADLRVSGPSLGDVRGRAFDAVAEDRFLTDDQKHSVTGLIENVDRNGELARHILATGNPEYRTAWAKTMTGRTELLDENERQAIANVRAQSLTSTQGGFAVPFTLDSTVLVTNDGRVNPLRQISRNVTITTDEWNGISSDGVSAAYTAEATQAADQTMEVAQPSIDVEKAQAFIKGSIEITQDWSNLAAELSRAFSDAKDDLEAQKFTLGGGAASNEPHGVVLAISAVTSSVVAASTTSEYNLVDVYTTQEALPPRHRPRAAWMTNLAFINRTRQFGTANNYHGFLTDLRGDAPAQLLGKPLYEASHMESTVTTGANVLLFGDFSRYLIVDRVGMSVEFIPHVFGANQRPTGERGWYAYWRNGAGVLDNNAFRILQLTA